MASATAMKAEPVPLKCLNLCPGYLAERDHPSHMGFDVLSAATTTGDQLANSDLLNSMVSKLIHDQAEISFYWAFTISSMLLQSLKMFFHQVWDHGTLW